MKTWNEINVNELLSLEDFLTLFENLPLNEEEKFELKGFHQVYLTFITAEVKPVDAWTATRNIFVVKNTQIGDRIKANKANEVSPLRIV
jgi:hypothetical protein